MDYRQLSDHQKGGHVNFYLLPWASLPTAIHLEGEFRRTVSSLDTHKASPKMVFLPTECPHFVASFLLEIPFLFAKVKAAWSSTLGC